jgi:hypothetical protein
LMKGQTVQAWKPRNKQENIKKGITVLYCFRASMPLCICLRVELYITFLSRRIYFLNEFIYLIIKAKVPFDTWLKFYRSPRRHIQKKFYPPDNTLKILNPVKRNLLC